MAGDCVLELAAETAHVKEFFHGDLLDAQCPAWARSSAAPHTDSIMVFMQLDVLDLQDEH
jgi:hypothetical protein